MIDVFWETAIDVLCSIGDSGLRPRFRYALSQ